MSRATSRRVVRAALSMVTLALYGCGGSTGDEPASVESVGAAPPEFVQRSAISLRQPPVATPIASELVEIRRELVALRTEVGLLQRRLNHAQTRPADAAQMAMRQAAQSEPERLAGIEAEFRTEASDPAWSRSAEARVRDAVAQLGDGLVERVRGLDCRSKTCRVEIAADDAQQVDDALPRIVTQLGDAFTSADAVHVDHGDRRPTGVLFLSR